MPAILTPQQWRGQPQFAVGLDLGAGKRLGVFYLAVADSAGVLRDLIGGASMKPGGIGVFDSARTATFNGAQQGNAAMVIPNSGSIMNVLVCGKLRATGAQAGSPGAAFGVYDSAGQNGIGVGFDSTNRVGAAWLTGNGAGMITYSASSVGPEYVVFSQASGAGGTKAQYSWIDGQPATTGQGSAAATGWTDTANEISIGAQHRSSGFLRNFTGDLEWAALIYKPALTTDAEALALFRSGLPYSLFNPRLT